MKNLLLFVPLFAASLLSAQSAKHEVRLSAMPIIDLVGEEQFVQLGAAASYMYYLRPQLGLGLSASYQTTDQPTFDKTTDRSRTGNIDALMRLRSKARRIVTWGIETGVSVQRTENYTSPFNVMGFCGTGLTEEDIREMQYFMEHGRYAYQTLGGVVLGLNLELRLSRKFAIGMELRNNTYYDLKRDENIWLGFAGIYGTYRW